MVLDLGTTGVKSLLFDGELNLICRDYRPIRTIRRSGGRVEQSPEQMIVESKRVLTRVLEHSETPAERISALAITNQRETILVWDRLSNKALYPAIVWEDKRTAGACREIAARRGRFVRELTGLEVSSYFSAPELMWLIKREKAIRHAAGDDRLAFGTVDSWLLRNLAEGAPHFTDQTNASRTLLYNIRTLDWDKRLLDIFGVPENCLPAVRPSASFYGTLRQEVVGARIPIMAVCGDQQAGVYAALELANRVCPSRGVTKATYGTGCFVNQTLGAEFKLVPGFYTTLVPNPCGQPNFCLEAKFDPCGSLVAPHLGNPKKLEGVLRLIARRADKIIRRLPTRPKELIIDGGVTPSARLRELQAEISGIKVKSQPIWDGTALGAAHLALDALAK